MKVIKPVETCVVCQNQFQELKSLYAMHRASPGDPGAKGVLQASLEIYARHHQEMHSLDIVSEKGERR